MKPEVCIDSVWCVQKMEGEEREPGQKPGEARTMG